MSNWRQIEGFPNYSVSDEGDVRNDLHERPVAITQNQRGLLKVGLSVNGKQYQRALSPLVAKHFVNGYSDVFNTPIHLDGNQQNCRWDNLTWRPSWFAVRYHAQWKQPSTHTIDVEILDTDTGETHRNSWNCAVYNGLLEKELVIATLNNRPVFPTNQNFVIIG